MAPSRADTPRAAASAARAPITVKSAPTAPAIPLRMPVPPCWIRLFMLGTATSLFGLADGCLRQSSPSTPNRPSDNHNDDHHSDAPMSHSTDAPSHRLPCYPYEQKEAACLNGGECFAVPGYGGQRHLGCKCPPMFTGVRCQEIYVDPSILELHQRNIRTAHVTAAVSVCVLVFFVVLLMVYVYVKFRRKSRIPPESMRGPRLEIAEYSSYNQKVRRLSAKAANGDGGGDKGADIQAQPAVQVQAKLPLSNGKDDLDTSKTPLLIENETPKKNGGLLGSAPVNNNKAREASVDPNQSFNPDLDDIGYIDETLPRKPKSKPKSQSAESQL